MEVCDEVFISKKDWIINELNSRIKTKVAMDKFEQKLFEILREALLTYSTKDFIDESYNRIRKVVDLYLEHIVAMAEEIDNETRKQLIQLLFLPIDDNWIIKNDLIFDDESINKWGLTRNSSFGEIKTSDLYYKMQIYLVRRANEVSMKLEKKFYVIYFDVSWNNRLYMPGGNLFGVQIDSNLANMKANNLVNIKANNEETKNSKASKDSNEHSIGLWNLSTLRSKDDDTSYPMLVKVLINEFKELGIYLGKDYKCIKRNDGGYIFEAISPRGRRKNIVTMWPNKQGGGDIRIVSIGKYENRRCFDYSDLGTSAFREDLLRAYRYTQ